MGVGIRVEGVRFGSCGVSFRVKGVGCRSYAFGLWTFDLGLKVSRGSPEIEWRDYVRKR